MSDYCSKRSINTTSDLIEGRGERVGVPCATSPQPAMATRKTREDMLMRGN